MKQDDDTSPKNSVAVTDALVALGANLPGPKGDPAAAIDWAKRALGRPVESSRTYRTPAFPEGSGPDFANAVIRFSWDGTAAALLALLHEIEAEAGRTRDVRWEARVLDLDLIALGSKVSPSVDVWRDWSGLSLSLQKNAVPDELILPHPRIAERAFVLVPLAELAPEWEHPVLGRTASALLADLPAKDRASVRPWETD